MSKCARPGCPTIAKSLCSVCLMDHYCSSSCQKTDWKIHKSLCPILKKLSSKLLPFHEAIQVIKEIGASEKENDARVLEHLMSYAEYQFGKEDTGKNYREREDGERISNWNVDRNILYNINFTLIELNRQNKSFSTRICDDMMFPYLERSLSLLNPWLLRLDADASNTIDSPNEQFIEGTISYGN